MKYVTIKKLAELSGYTEKALRNKIEKGILVQGIHWKYDPTNRIQFNLEAYEKWVEEQPGVVSMRGKSRSSSISNGENSALGKRCA